MPNLQIWRLHHPKDWTPEQALQYMRDTTTGLNQVMLPTLHALGPTHTVSIMLTVIVQIARFNPVYIRDILDKMVGAAEIIEGLDPLKGAVRN